MNVALGGTMYQDLRARWPKERSRLVRHRARGRVSSSNWVTHPVQLCRPDSRLALAVKGRGELGRPVLESVLSMHHQAVEALASGLEVSATAPDGVIEAFEDSSPIRWWVATQFHPEWSTHLHWVMGLFSAFVDASRAYSAVPRGEIEPLRAEIMSEQHERKPANFVVTKGYRLFAEMCDACRQARCVGLGYGPQARAKPCLPPITPTGIPSSLSCQNR